jgi:mRNA interferase RelE/StbE
MGNYRILVKKSAAGELERIPRKDLIRIVKRMTSLAGDPRPPGCEKLSALERYRVRQGDHRIVYSVDDAARTVLIFKIGHRKEVYRK